MQVAIEPATSRTIEEMLKIERACFTAEAYTREQILRLLENPNAVALSARMDAVIVGFVIGLIEGKGTAKIGHIVTIDIAVRYRQRGIGSMLLSEIERSFSRRNVGIAYLEVRADNQAARRLYQKLGYKEAELLADCYSPSVRGLRLVKKLEPKRDDSFFSSQCAQQKTTAKAWSSHRTS